jgi:hypothetical protein
MDFLLQDLNNRKREIEEYLKLITFLDSSKKITNQDGNNFKTTSLLVKTIKGSIYLLLYNLVESTMREAIVAIHDDITASNSAFDDLRQELQKKIILRAKQDGIAVEALQMSLSDDISINFHRATLRKKTLFSGNIDREKIKAVAQTYGFSHDTTYSLTSHGEQLDTVKQHRNDLAHGNKTFSGIGSEKSAQELQVFSEKVIAYIYAIFDNISDSLEHKKYLRN